MYNGEWKENWNGRLLLSSSAASGSPKYCFHMMFSNIYRPLGVQWGRQKSLDRQEDGGIVIHPFSQRCNGEQLE